MTEHGQASRRQGVEETVLWHPERIDVAVTCAALLAVMIKGLISFIQKQDVSDVVPLLFLWGTAVVGVIIAMIWSVGVSTVIERGPEDVTVSWSLAGLIRRRVASFPLKDLTNVVARERLYGIKGRKTRRYEILYGPEREKSEFLVRLTRRHIELLASGVFLGMLKVDS